MKPTKPTYESDPVRLRKIVDLMKDWGYALAVSSIAYQLHMPNDAVRNELVAAEGKRFKRREASGRTIVWELLPGGEIGA